MKCVGLNGDDVVWSEFFGAAREHLVGKVNGENGCGYWGGRPMFVESHRHVAGAATEIEGDGLGMLEDWLEKSCRAVPPPLVDAGGDKVIRTVVGGSNGVEHLLDGGGGVLFAGDAGWACAGGDLVLGRA